MQFAALLSVKESLVRGSLQLLPLMGLYVQLKEPLRLRDFRLLQALELMRLRVYGLLPALLWLELHQKPMPMQAIQTLMAMYIIIMFLLLAHLNLLLQVHQAVQIKAYLSALEL